MASTIPVGVEQDRASVLELVHRIGADVVAPAADAVDRDARFPRESIDALRDARLLGALIPRTLGGRGLDFELVASVCEALGQYCASTAMVYAMHQIQVACLVRHTDASLFWREYLDDLAAREGLIASVTSEVGIGGDVRSSLCAVAIEGRRFAVEKQAPVISYGQHADDYLITARRMADSPPSDQVLVLSRRDETSLTRVSEWNTLGFRGTCSEGFRLRAGGAVEQILPAPYAEISSQTMLPVSHILWASLWTGIAASAVSRARTFVRREARKGAGAASASSLRAVQLVTALQGMRSHVRHCAAEYAAIMHDSDALGAPRFAILMNNLKIAASTAVVDIVGQALLICGISGYKIESEFALGRHLRDAYGAMLMINNDRVAAATASLLLVSKDD